ncbi:copper amine oxidase N-terminal domain-containing protein [Paenibacillus dendritiformis]|uniref:copper amine oxidase N-terminal domain-containing protein n=1 Tax=Paenibacillus dendritiformis TaxID=130049 RepID=UPI00143D95D9|nr:copper amine oxidase N-terminal domain-containing protein [Paenibacillus dendritiformis]NKI22100.1 copper amine oxidase N-terminal domain-containing protein [Paenibacillus dendritiformis]NRF98711.1 copper amine oxidase N-terminal domain-containing protein [Paenibacillus dendritiformis]
MMFTQRKRWIIASIAVLLGTGSIAPEALAHPGRTDKYGGHTCRTNCEKWGLEYGEYHYHNGSSRSSRASSSKPAGSNAGSTKSKSSSTGGRATSKSKSKPAPAKKQPQPVEAGITVSWNKEAVSLSSKPVRYQDQLMLPLLDTLDAFGISYSVKDKAIHIKEEEQQVIVPIKHNEKNIQIGGKTVKLTVPLIIANGKLMVPLSFFREALSCTLSWDESAQHLQIAR